MGRPRKDRQLLMNQPLRIMLTADQKRLIEDAAALDQPEGVAAWARAVLLDAAKQKLVKQPTANG